MTGILDEANDCYIGTSLATPPPMTDATRLPQNLRRSRRRPRPRRASLARIRRRPRRAREEAAQDSHPGRHGVHRARAGRVRDRARALGHAHQSQQDAPRLLQGTRRPVDRRSERRHERAQRAQVRRRDRQSDDAARMGAERRAVHEGQHRSLHLHLDDLGVRERQDRVGRRERCDASGADQRRSVRARSDHGADACTARSRRRRSAKSRRSTPTSSRSFVLG